MPILVPSISVCRAAGAIQQILRESETMLSVSFENSTIGQAAMRVRDRLVVLGDRFSVRESVVMPKVFVDAMDDIAVEGSLAMKKRGMRLCDVRDRMGVSDKRTNAISRYLRGSDHPVGILGAFRFAEAMKVPIRILVGEEAILHPQKPRRRRAPRPVFDGQLALPLDIVEYHP